MINHNDVLDLRERSARALVKALLAWDGVRPLEECEDLKALLVEDPELLRDVKFLQGLLQWSSRS